MSQNFQAMLLALAIVPLSSCADRTLASIEIKQIAEETVGFDVSQRRDIDLLFVIDNSNSMDREQTSLADKFSHLIGTLAQHPDGLPSIHIGVISTDLGGLGPGCSESGDGGRFLGGSCPGLDGPFLKSIALDSGERETNFSGELEDVFACMATLGTRGCGFEQPLESMRQALSLPQAQDFLRDEAYLAVIIVTDEDDCSVHDTGMFDGAVQGLDTHLGPPKSFRCFEFGVECAGDEPRRLGVHTDCVPREDSQYLHDVHEYAEFLYDLKLSPDQLLVASIAGELEPVDVVKRWDSMLNLDYLALEYSCTEVDAEAVPPIRLSAFVNSFGVGNSRTTSICEEDLSGALQDIADAIVGQLSPCIQSELADTDPDADGLQPECIVTESGPGQRSRRLDACDNVVSPEVSSDLPCYTLQPSDDCPDTPTGLSPRVYYAPGYTVPFGTQAVANCLVGP